MIALTADELMAWNKRTTEGWRQLAAQHPELLGFPCDVRETRNVAELMRHIVAVELRYTQRLLALPESPYDEVPIDSAEAIYAVHDKTMTLLEALLAREEPAWWEGQIEFTTITAGRVRSSRRAVLVHLLMHSLRHYAQLATLVRQHGVKPGWPMDYLYMDHQRAR